MAYIGEYYQCDICKKPKIHRSEVRNSVYVENGEGSGNYYQVCHPCVVEICKVIKERQPVKENKPEEVEVK